MSKNKTYDVIVMGASGFTGRLVCEYLVDRYGVDGDLRWAIAGRNAEKLAGIRDDLSDGAKNLPILTADSHNADDLNALVQQTKVVCTTVGPYALYGSELVAACVKHGTDYCDLSGEVPWMRKMLDQYHETAQKSGARIVHCCGFDSVPSDMGTWFIQQQAKQQFGQPLTRLGLRMKAAKGGLSGGTFASMLNIVEEAKTDPNVAKILKNPYALCPPDARKGPRQPYVGGPRLDQRLNSWMAPFVMAAINTRIVMRANALQHHEYGTGFRYDEAVLTGKGFGGRMKALTMSAGMGAFAFGASLRPTRALLKKLVLPKPGEGPSKAQREAGFFNIILQGETDDGQSLRARVKGDRDPGYGSTSKMLGEAAVCLARDIGNEVQGGMWTPSTALGQPYLKRLAENAGVTIELEEH